MKHGIIALFMAAAFAGGQWLAGEEAASADAPAKNRQWQYQCFQAEGVAQVTERSNKMGEQGWELVTSAGTKGETLWCFKRTLWKP